MIIKTLRTFNMDLELYQEFMARKARREVTSLSGLINDLIRSYFTLKALKPEEAKQSDQKNIEWLENQLIKTQADNIELNKRLDQVNHLIAQRDVKIDQLMKGGRIIPSYRPFDE